MPIDIKYQAHAQARGGRDGRVTTEDGELDFKLVIPRELGGPGGPGANPEKLFALGYSACFLGALRAVASHQKRRIPDDATVKATVGIGPNGEGGFGLAVALSIALPGLAQDEAEDLVRKAHHTCPYSNALRGKVEVSINLAGQGGSLG
ncbi:MAG: organic hydroperoxide resistance protein [Caulobacteraceae bacterium]